MKSSRHILVIRFSAMGDVAMCVPVLKVLSEKYPALRIIFLTKPLFSPLFADLHNVEVFEADVKEEYKGIHGLWKLFQNLKIQKIDAVADLHQVLRSQILKLFFRASGIPVKQIDKGRKEKKALTRPKNKNFRQLKTTPGRYADVFAELGFPVDLSNFKPIPKKELSEKIKKVTGEKEQKWLGIAPFAAHASKVYPLPLMKEIIASLQEQKEVKIFLFGGGEKEREILGNWEREFRNTINLVDKLTFEEELRLISNLDLMLSMDSGNAHLAANYGIPVITLWGLTHPFAGFAPFGQSKENLIMADRKKYPQIPTSVYGKKIPKGYENAMESISAGRVIKRVTDLLKEH